MWQLTKMPAASSMTVYASLKICPLGVQTALPGAKGGEGEDMHVVLEAGPRQVQGGSAAHHLYAHTRDKKANPSSG